jgi:hypothetical protein
MDMPVDETTRNATRLDRLEQQVIEIKVKQENHDTRISVVENTLNTISSNTTWILRIIIGLIVVGVIGMAFNFNRIQPQPKVEEGATAWEDSRSSQLTNSFTD